MLSFQSFQKEFLRELESPKFGEEPRALKPGSLSPTINELRRKNAEALLRGELFLKSIHKLLTERDRLANEQPRVRATSRELRPIIKKLRDAEMTVATIEKKFEELTQSLRSIDLETFYRALAQIQDCRAKLRVREGELVLQLPPTEREEHWWAHGWVPLLKPYNYNLPTLHAKAPDQWLLESINAKLIATFRAKGKTLSQMTRCRIMYTILRVVRQEIPPTTIKQYFQAKKIVDRAARNFPRS